MKIKITHICDRCHGDGEYEIDIERPHDAGRDVGEIEARLVPCEKTGCEDGEISHEQNFFTDEEGSATDHARHQYPDAKNIEEKK
jgi:hypothetical protein|tara:strand:- start:118 stop:372 length:255 start_codon:yes stop_codon:yes gene_type:complete